MPDRFMRRACAVSFACFYLAFGSSAWARGKPKGKTVGTGYIGHYGYLLEIPSDLRVEAGFKGSMETVFFTPPACKGLDDSQCVGKGLFSVMVVPKRDIPKLKKQSVSLWVKNMVKEALENGEGPGELFDIRIGNLKGWTYYRERHPEGPFNMRTVVDGKKVIYLFGYDVTDPAIVPVIQSLTEAQAHDNAPRR